MPSKEPLNKSRGQGTGVLKDLERGVCQKQGQAGSPPRTEKVPSKESVVAWDAGMTRS